MLTFFQTLPARSPLATLCQQLLPLSQKQLLQGKGRHTKTWRKPLPAWLWFNDLKAQDLAVISLIGNTSKAMGIGLASYQRLIKVICWPIHKAPAAFSRTFPTFNKSLTYTVWHRDVSGHAEGSHSTVKWSTRKSRSAATQHWSQGNNSEQANHKPKVLHFRIQHHHRRCQPCSTLPSGSPPHPSAQPPRRGLPAFPSFSHFSGLLLKST